MRIRNKMFTMAISMTVLSAAIMTGCAAAETGGTAMAEKGFLTLSVNPEIQIEYNKDGKVTALTGQNDDGIKILKEYPDYVGKDCEAVIKDLIVEINEAGYFVEDIDGNTKNIVLQLEPGSVLPDDDFLEDMTSSTQNAIKDLNLGSGIVTIDDDDYDPAYAKEGKPSHYITLEKAQEIALTQAGISAADAVFEDKEFDHDDGTPVFELEFEAAGQDFEYDIHAVTGKVIRAEHQSFDEQNDDYNDTDYGPENDGVTDYNDTDYGPENDGVTDYNDTDYGPENDGVTDYNDNDDGVSNYDDSNDDQDDGVSNYDDNSDDQDSDDDDDGASDYDD